MRVSRVRRTLFRYPGGKGKVADVITKVLVDFLRMGGREVRIPRAVLWGRGRSESV